MNQPTLLTLDEQALLNHYRQLVAGGTRGLPAIADDFARLTRPNAAGTEAADAYLRDTLGIDLPLAGWYSQGYYWDQEQAIGSPTIRFALEGGGYWERLLDRPERFGKLKDRFSPGLRIADAYWIPPGLEDDLHQLTRLYIVPNILTAISLACHGILAVATLHAGRFPEKLLARLAPSCTLVWSLGNDSYGKTNAAKHAVKAQALGFTSEVRA